MPEAAYYISCVSQQPPLASNTGERSRPAAASHQSAVSTGLGGCGYIHATI